MRRPTLVLLFLTMTADADAQPVSNPAPPIGHESVALGIALGYSAQAGGRAGSDEGAETIELFAGWAFGRVAAMAWVRGRRGHSSGAYDLGLAARAWPFTGQPRIYTELRGGRTAYSVSGDPNPTLKGHGVVAGGGFGLELVNGPGASVDARVMVDRGIMVEREDYTVLSFDLAVHLY